MYLDGDDFKGRTVTATFDSEGVIVAMESVNPDVGSEWVSVAAQIPVPESLLGETPAAEATASRDAARQATHGSSISDVQPEWVAARSDLHTRARALADALQLPYPETDEATAYYRMVEEAGKLRQAVADEYNLRKRVEQSLSSQLATARRRLNEALRARNAAFYERDEARANAQRHQVTAGELRAELQGTREQRDYYQRREAELLEEIDRLARLATPPDAGLTLAEQQEAVRLLTTYQDVLVNHGALIGLNNLLRTANEKGLTR